MLSRQKCITSAERCEKQARQSSDPSNQRILEAIALTWRNLADGYRHSSVTSKYLQEQQTEGQVAIPPDLSSTSSGITRI